MELSWFSGPADLFTICRHFAELVGDDTLYELEFGSTIYGSPMFSVREFHDYILVYALSHTK